MSTENTHFGAAQIGEMLKNCHRIFFIGIGGINMSSLALITKQRGYEVGGSDHTDTALTRRLSESGIRVFYGHDSGQVMGYDAVVYTVAISPENPEYRWAQEEGIPCISRADYLGYIMTGYRRRVGIAGMHGKSSCTSMCAQVLLEADANPTVLSGAELPLMGGAFHVGGDENFVFEACEYMDSFLDFNPTVAVILNIEMDHVDYFKSMEQIRTSYAHYAARTGEGGVAIVNRDDAEVLLAMEDYKGALLTFGISSENADFRAVGISQRSGRYSFDILWKNEFFCHVDLSVTGYHHIYNALATAAACRLCGLDGKTIASGLSHFTGAARRMEYKGSLGGAEVYDDYGHHPTEIRATLSGARGLPKEGGRLICVYQPHTYSRTAALLDEFATSFEAADRVILAKIYAARETDTLGVSSALLAERIGEKAEAIDSFGEIAERLKTEAREGDTVVVMGAGDVYRVFGYLDLKKTEG